MMMMMEEFRHQEILKQQEENIPTLDQFEGTFAERSLTSFGVSDYNCSRSVIGNAENSTTLLLINLFIANQCK